MFRTAAERERHTITSELSPGFLVEGPDRPSIPFVFCSPHSGRVYPNSFRQASRLSSHALRKSEDNRVDELLADVCTLGAPLIHARFPRAYLDLNREPYELDPLLFTDILPEFANTRSVRVMSGLGTIARVVADNEPIYRNPLPLAVAYERIARLYRPFHSALEALLDRCGLIFGHAVLVDCHSMPSSSHSNSGQPRPDIVLGDRYGLSCDPELTTLLADALEAEGFEVALNRPYAGGFITEHYGKPSRHRDAIQIEINRSLYMDETTLERSATFDDVRHSINRALQIVTTAYPSALTSGVAEAAE